MLCPSLLKVKAVASAGSAFSGSRETEPRTAVLQRMQRVERGGGGVPLLSAEHEVWEGRGDTNIRRKKRTRRDKPLSGTLLGHAQARTEKSCTGAVCVVRSLLMAA